MIKIVIIEFIALYLLFTEVSAFVIKHVSLGSKAFPTALSTHERSGVLVNSAVNLQILLFAKTFATGRKLAPEWLSPIVLMHVGSQTDFALEALRAPREGAWEADL